MTKKTIYLILFAMLIALSSSSEAFKISGKIVDEENKPLKGAKIIVSDTTIKSKFTDFKGRFELTIPGNNAVIQVSFTGMETKELNVTKDSVKMVIVLKGSTVELKDSSIAVDKMYGKRIKASSPIMPAYEKRASSEGGEGIDLGTMSSAMEFKGEGIVRGSSPQKKAGSGLLTAGEVNDFTKWNLWTDISNNVLADYQKLWGFTPQERYTVLFQTKNKFPLFGAKVILKDNSKIIWESVTDNTGKAELWNNAFNTKEVNSNKLTIELKYEGKTFEVNNPKIFHNGINFVFSDMTCKAPLEADIAFVVDATGSMQDEINYLKADLNNIISSIKDSIPSIDLNLGSVFYRDNGDAYITKHSEMSNDIQKTVEFIKANNAGGGGDAPEAVHSGLNTAINKLKWRENSVARIIFLILDAPPHNEKYVIDSLMILIHSAAQKGIRIIPVTCSGINKSTEYLMRAMALFTNGTYTFLTDDSGIGNPHIKPTTDKYDVETLNALLKRLIYQYITIPKCDIVNNNLSVDTTSVEVVVGVPKDSSKVDSSSINSTNQNPENIPDKLSIKCYPNPTSGILNIETSGKIEELFISDVSGKLMSRTEVKNQNNITLNLSDYPNGTYYALCIYNTDKILKGKFIIIH
jgi:hypothetical protein